MVRQDVGNLLISEIGECRTNVLDGFIGWREDGNIGCIIDSVSKISRVDGTT